MLRARERQIVDHDFEISYHRRDAPTNLLSSSDQFESCSKNLNEDGKLFLAGAITVMLFQGNR